MSSWLTSLEKTLDDLFTKKIPVKIPAGARKAIANALWFAAIVMGLIALWSAVTIWGWGHSARLSLYDLYLRPAVYLGPAYYLALWSTAAVGVLSLLAVTNLKIMKKQGWNLLYYVILIQTVAVALRLFSAAAGGPGGFIGWGVADLVEAFVLFQVREYFSDTQVTGHKIEHLFVEDAARSKGSDSDKDRTLQPTEIPEQESQSAVRQRTSKDQGAVKSSAATKPAGKSKA